jgi:hypothetical protein
MVWKNKLVEWKSIPLVYDLQSAGRWALRAKSKE